MGHHLVSACCGAEIDGGKGDIEICSDCGEWAGFCCVYCEKDFDTISDAEGVPCFEEAIGNILVEIKERQNEQVKLFEQFIQSANVRKGEGSEG